MTSDVDISRRPSLEPLWTNYRNVGGPPKTIHRPIPINAKLSPSPLSPKSLPSPSPIHPASYDGSMRRQDRALVNSLDQRTKLLVNPVSLTPIEEYSPSPLVARLERISILPPMTLANGLPAPVTPDPSPRPENRVLRRTESIDLRDGFPVRQPQSPRFYYTANQPASPASPRRNPAAPEVQAQLRTWGHVYFGDARTADAFIIARSLRRSNRSQPPTTTAPTTTETSAALDPARPLASSNRLTVRAIVRPRDLDRPAFLIQRNLDVDSLRATVPDPPGYAQRKQAYAGGGVDEGQGPKSPAPNAPTQAGPRPRRASTARSGTLLCAGPNGLDLESLIRDAKAVPIHLRYARAFLPVVAALLESGHVREGDVVYLPVPHAEAWRQTARYVYTGQGELTDAVRENIVYLAGKV